LASARTHASTVPPIDDSSLYAGMMTEIILTTQD
jgi:hypothetical protein